MVTDSCSVCLSRTSIKRVSLKFEVSLKCVFWNSKYVQYNVNHELRVKLTKLCTPCSSTLSGRENGNKYFIFVYKIIRYGRRSSRGG